MRTFMNPARRSAAVVAGNLTSVTLIDRVSPFAKLIPRSGLSLKPMNCGFFSLTPGAAITAEARDRSRLSSMIRAWSWIASPSGIPWSVRRIIASLPLRSSTAMAGVAALHTLTSNREGAPKSGLSWGIGFEVRARSRRS